MDLFENEQFGKYIFDERIAVGGMAEIFKAKLRGLGGFEKTLVIKRLHPSYSEDHQFVKMLIDEATISFFTECSLLTSISNSIAVPWVFTST